MIPQELYTEIKRSFPLNARELLIFNKESKVLLVKRANEPAKGQWWIPGGRVRFAETRLDAAKRLLKEECGIESEDLSLEGMFDYMIRNEEDNYFQHTISSIYRVHVENDDIHTDDQSSDYAWKSIEDWASLVESDFLKHLLTKNYGAINETTLSAQHFTFDNGFIRNELYATILESLAVPCVDLVVKNKKGEILLVKRKNEPAQDKWWVPGGRVLHGEQRINAAKRKLMEECGLKAGSFKELGTFEFVFNKSESQTYHNIATLFEVQVDGDLSVMLDKQSEAYSWKTA